MLRTHLTSASLATKDNRLPARFWRTSFLKPILLTMVFIVFSLPYLVYSQVDAPQSDQVSTLLAEIESQNKTRTVYSVGSRLKIAEVEFDSGFEIVKNLGQWSIVRFNQNTVPGWVSDDYVIVNNGRAVVNATNLNMRLRPSLNSPVMLQLELDYESRILDRKNGFVRLFAPRAYHVAIFAGSDEEARLNLTKSTITKIDNNSDRHAAGSAKKRVAMNPDTTTTGVGAASASKQAEVPPQAKESNTNERLHIIAPGDSISLQVFGESDLSIQNVRVPQSGRVSFPLIGSVPVAGRTTPDVEKSVAELLAQGYVKSPRLSVTISSYRPIFIRGAVNKTASFPFSEGMTVGNMITLAGGSKKSAKRDGVSILRNGTVVEEGLSIDSIKKIQPGDVISVEEEFGVQEGNTSYIYLHGEVSSPGEYQFRRGLTVEKAIVLAGGFTLRGSRKKISLTRYADVEADQEPEKINRVKLYTPIKPGDIIKVGATWF